MLTVDYGGGGLVVDYVIKILIFTNFSYTNWTIFVDFVVNIFIFTNFEKKLWLIINRVGFSEKLLF